MALLYTNLGVAYFPVPKCASSSLKFCLHEANTGLAPKRQDLRKHIRMRSFAQTNLQELEGYEKMAVVREPVARLKSCYADRILRRHLMPESHPDKRYIKHHEGEERKLKSCNLPEYPDFQTFADHFEEYRDISRVVRNHTPVLSHWLGSDPLFFDAIFDFGALPALEEWLRTRGGGGSDNLP
ncbi:MAG: sulfotransferase family 2 domain-containing protein [Rhodobacteraceae bacterium]|nr:sulfotransferase family 2 domain-containing protein [Paracoccaceae bacterium]